MIITDRFTKLTQAVPLQRIDAYVVACAFAEELVLKYGSPEIVLSGNGSQFASQFFRRVCQVMGVANDFTNTYHPQTNVQNERDNWAILGILRCYIRDHQGYWDEYVQVITYAYNTSIHTSHNFAPFDLEFTRAPPELSIDNDEEVLRQVAWKSKEDWVLRMDGEIRKVRDEFKKAQVLYKKNFDGRMRRGNLYIT